MKNLDIFLNLFFFALMVQIQWKLVLVDLFCSLMEDVLQISPLCLLIWTMRHIIVQILIPSLLVIDRSNHCIIWLHLRRNCIRMWFAMTHLRIIVYFGLTCVRELLEVSNFTIRILLRSDDFIINFIFIKLTHIHVYFVRKWLRFKLIILGLFLIILYPMLYSLSFDLVTIQLGGIGEYWLSLIEYALFIIS